MRSQERVPQTAATPSTPNSRLPGIARVTNSTTARAAALIAALTATAACSSDVEVGSAVISNEGCSPVPTCPRSNLSAQGPHGNDYYLSSDRWYRVDPVSNEIFEVCDPTERDFCEEGETPEADGCDLPVCPGAQEAMCDPIPARKDNSPSRLPAKAYFPTSNKYAESVHWVNDDNLNHPVIYDNTPDCEEGDNPNGDSNYTCDMIPTCETTIPYCDPMPRCQPGQSPISCEEGEYRFSFYDDCLDYINSSGTVISNYNMSIIPGIDNICEEQYDPNINEYFYSPPYIYINCLPIDECSEGEEPYKTTLSVDIDCGQWGSWTSVNDYAPSCDPIKSCK